MEVFTHYIEPLTQWLYHHQHWAFFFTFLLSFAESLAIVGSIVPGSLAMTSIGILAGTGIVPISHTLIAAILGAIAGDSASYSLGYIFSDRLGRLWPFSRYPTWLQSGQEYFTQHGGKSVLIGRFLGPLRSIIPVIAGMMRMNSFHFLLANVASAIGWSLVYVMPGVLIGAAGNELSSEGATRLFIVILVIIACVWIGTQLIKWLFLHAHHWLRIHVHRYWQWLLYQPLTKRAAAAITPVLEENYFPTAALLFSCIILGLLSLFLTISVVYGLWITTLNHPIQLFFQSIRTKKFDIFFIIIGLIVNRYTLLVLLTVISIRLAYIRNWRTLRYLVSLGAITGVILLPLLYYVNTPKLDTLIQHQTTSNFPTIGLTFATSILSFLILYINTRRRNFALFIGRMTLIGVLMMGGIGALYLGDAWMTSVLGGYCIGLTISLFFWLYYRRFPKAPKGVIELTTWLFLVLILTTGIGSFFFLKQHIQKHSPYLQQYTLTHRAWWHQKKPILPLYTTNRFGHPIGLFNIQYLGSLSHIKQALTEHDWKIHQDSALYSLLLLAKKNTSKHAFPIMPQLYLNHKPALTVTHRGKNNNTLYILRLWRSNFHILGYSQPLWLGSLSCYYTTEKNRFIVQHDKDLQPLFTALKGFAIKSSPFHAHYTREMATPSLPTLLMIEDPTLLLDEN